MPSSWIYLTIGVIVASIGLGALAFNTALEQQKRTTTTISHIACSNAISGSPRSNITLDKCIEAILKHCEPSTIYLSYGLGSMNVLIKGQENDMCSMKLELEIEMGRTRFNCSIPVDRLNNWIGWRGKGAVPSLQGIESYCGSGKTWVKAEVTCVGLPYRCFISDPSEPLGANLSADPAMVDESIKNYYRNKDITIFDVKYKPTFLSSCEFGECPDKYALYLLVSTSDVDKMLREGFEGTGVVLLNN